MRQAAQPLYAQTYPLRRGWCCRHFLAEAILFGVLMPLIVAAHWLGDVEYMESNQHLTNRYVAAECTLNRLVTPARQVKIQGKSASDTDA